MTPPDLEFLIRCGWSNAELIWEQILETAGACDQDGEVDEAADLWAGALEVAREHFDERDPRLATSLANQGVSRRRAGDESAAQTLFAEALAVWDSSATWLAALRPESRARSSTFHLRLETKHPRGYEHFCRQRYQVLAGEGRAGVEALCRGDRRPGSLARWRDERPLGFNDLRKLMGAVLLMAEDGGSISD